jgi:hypothetical protein
MRAKQAWTLQSLFTCILWNAILIGVLFYAASRTLRGIHAWMSTLLQSEAPSLPEEAQQALAQLGNFLKEIQHYLVPAVIGLGVIITFFLWLFVFIQGRGLARRTLEEAAGAPAALPRDEALEAKAKDAGGIEALRALPSPQPAVQMLTILQREGRLIDFLQEDLSLYEDAQIGAAVRSIHRGCKDSLSEYVDLKPIFEESEGVEVTVQPDFDSGAIRLTGNVTGNPPFKGILRHRGWRAVRVELPRPVAERGEDWIVAPAEVELT